MDNVSLVADIIKNNVSAIDAGKAIGLNVDNHNRCSCPFHNGKDRNMKLYDGNRGFSCFVCHESGDVIKLVRKYHDMSFKDVISWFNDTFNLGMDIDSPMSPDALREAKEAQRKRMAKNTVTSGVKELRSNRENIAMDIKLRLEKMADRYAPKDPDADFDNRFLEAVRMNEYMGGVVYDIQIKNMEAEK